VGAIFVGLLLGVIAVLFHNSYSPFGLIIALLESAVGIYYFVRFSSNRVLHFIALASWISIIYNAGSFGVSDEILIEGNINGFLLLIGGLALNFVALIKGKRIS
jgi:hypothetical protein